MRNRRLIFVLTVVMILVIVLRKLGFGYASLLLNITVFVLALIILFSKEIFRTILARSVLSATLLASLAILQYWLESKYIILPVVLAFFFYMILSFKYVQHKPTGSILFLFIFTVFLLHIFLNPRQFHNLFKPTSYEDYILSKYRQDQGLLADLMINRYKIIDKQKSDDCLAKAFILDSLKQDEALEYYSCSIENNPDNFTAYHRRGYYKLSRLELNPPNVVSALKDFSRAIRLDSKFAEAYYHRSMALNYLGYKDRAFLDQITVIQLDSILPEQQFETKYGRSKKSLSIPPDS